MDKINFFPTDLNVQNQKIILRLDLNVPLKDKIIIDDTRINLCLPFIERLIKKSKNLFSLPKFPNIGTLEENTKQFNDELELIVA